MLHFRSRKIKLFNLYAIFIKKYILNLDLREIKAIANRMDGLAFIDDFLVLLTTQNTLSHIYLFHKGLYSVYLQ